jgi:hypothetical protein
MGAEYSFVSQWRIEASAERCWVELERMLHPDAPSWWPGFSIDEPPARIAAGEAMTVAVRSPIGYVLHARLTLTEIGPGRTIAAESTGDLHGTGRVIVEPDGADSCVVTWHWDVETEKTWMNATAGVLRSMFERAHAYVMSRGEEGLKEVLHA